VKGIDHGASGVRSIENRETGQSSPAVGVPSAAAGSVAPINAVGGKSMRPATTARSAIRGPVAEQVDIDGPGGRNEDRHQQANEANAISIAP